MKSERLYPIRAGFFLRLGILAGALALLGVCVLIDGANSADERRWMWISAGGCFALALGFVIAIAFRLGQSLSLSESGIRIGAGALIKWMEVSEIDLEFWEDRGLARVRADAEGARKTLTIEQSRYLDAPEIIQQLLERCGRAQIVRNARRSKAEIRGSSSGETLPRTARKTVF